MAGAWATTITIDAGETSETFARINSTQDAAHYLLDHWQRERSPMYCAAIRMCANAIKGQVSHEAAYISFMAAVREANVALITNRRYDVTDELTLEIEKCLAVSILAELRAGSIPQK